MLEATGTPGVLDEILIKISEPGGKDILK